MLIIFRHARLLPNRDKPSFERIRAGGPSNENTYKTLKENRRNLNIQYHRDTANVTFGRDKKYYYV